MAEREKYVDLGQVQNDRDTGLPGVNQQQLMRMIEAMLQGAKTRHPFWSYERAAYEASVGMVQRVGRTRIGRYLGWLRQRWWEKRLLYLRHKREHPSTSTGESDVT